MVGAFFIDKEKRKNRENNATIGDLGIQEVYKGMLNSEINNLLCSTVIRLSRKLSKIRRVKSRDDKIFDRQVANSKNYPF